MPYVKEHIRLYKSLKHLCLASLANLKSSWDAAFNGGGKIDNEVRSDQILAKSLQKESSFNLLY